MAAVNEPPEVVTTTGTGPATPDAGVVTVIEVAVSAVTVPALPPTVTVADNSSVPLMVTVVPPAVGPELGVIRVMAGGNT